MRFFSALKDALIRPKEESLRSHSAVLRLLSPVKAGSLLDVGCGDGWKTSAFASLLGIAAGGVRGIEVQERHAQAAASKFPVERLDLEKDAFPFPDQAFDLVVCDQVLEHLKNIYLPLREMDRVVRRGGHLLVGVPNMAGLYARLQLLFGRQPLSNLIDGPHVRGFAYHDMRAFLSKNGNFRLEAVGSSNLYPLPYPLLEMLSGRLPGLSSYVYFLLKKVSHDPQGCAWRETPGMDTCF